jgi:hypothetical protein
MTTNPQVSELIRKHQAARRAEFNDPQYEEFRSTYAKDVPADLRDLFSLRELLVKTGIQLETPSGALWFESFCPLSATMIQSSARLYAHEYIQFGKGGENQAYLCRIANPERVWIDYESDSNNLEELPVLISDIVASIRLTT